MNPVLEKVVESPQMPQLYAELGRILAEEERRRQQFYATMQEGEKTEFINGEVILHSPVKLRHTQASKHLLMLLDAFVRKYHLGFVGHEKIMISLSRNDYEPDVCFFNRDKAQQFKPDQMHFPAPDFVAEVLSPSTEAIDRGVKFQDYAIHDVQEYWLLDPESQTLEQYLLAEDNYYLAVKATDGTVHSQAVGGFAIPIRALFDEAENLRVLGTIVGSGR